MNVYIIRDIETGNYVSDEAFCTVDKEKKKWLYSSYTGKCSGFRYYTCQERVEEIINNLNTISKKLRINKVFSFANISLSKIPKGEGVYEHLNYEGVILV